MGFTSRLKIGVLTSSRADFGIYLPLLYALKSQNAEFEIEIIAFGTHLSSYHGFTLNWIVKNGFEVKHQISSMLISDDEGSIATSYALTALKFAEFWKNNHRRFDWVICLGDRFEMAAAVSVGIPFGIKFAHIGGGDTTIGAIDNIYRDAISLASNLHFVSLKIFEKKIKKLIGNNADCRTIGSLSLENLNNVKILTKKEFLKVWGLDFRIPTILITFHPETVNTIKNVKHCEILDKALKKLSQSYQLLITLPNADTNGSIYRKSFESMQSSNPKGIKIFNNLGTDSYFSSMLHASILLGNTSSGIVEAASFGKYVVDVGDRQKGRITSKNVIHVPYDFEAIIKAINKYNGQFFTGKNIYIKKNSTEIILNALKEHGNRKI